MEGKRLARTVLSALAPVARLALRGRSLILAYHNVVPDDGRIPGDATLHLRRSDFRSQLAELRRSWCVVPLSEILTEPADPRPRIAVTFDDAYRGALELGLPELERYEIPATVFVAPGCLGAPAFWWDELADEDGGGLAEDTRTHALEALQGDGARIRAWAARAGRPPRSAPRLMQPATVEELESAARSPLLRVGSHTWTHPNLSRVSDSRLDEELTRSREWLAARFPSSLPWLSYPYGSSDPGVERAARAAGYEAALRVEGGWLARRPPNRFALPRLNVPAGISPAAFRLRLAGVLPR